jgi:peptide chain release factor 3
LREEGAVQVFYPWGSTRTEPILGAVGELQFEVAKYRLESEYNVKTQFDVLSYSLALHVEGEREQIERASLPSNAKLVEDWSGRPIALFESEWSVRLAQEWNPSLRFVAFPAQAGEEAVA